MIGYIDTHRPTRPRQDDNNLVKRGVRRAGPYPGEINDTGAQDNFVTKERGSGATFTEFLPNLTFTGTDGPTRNLKKTRFSVLAGSRRPRISLYARKFDPTIM